MLSTVSVLGRDYCSTWGRLLQYLVQVLRALVVPVNVLFVAIKLHLIGNVHFFQRIEDENLLRGWERAHATSTLKVGVTAPVVYAYRHKLPVLCGEHALLKIGKATSIYHGLAVSKIGARLVLGAAVRANESKILFLFHQCGVCHLMQTGVGHRALSMFTNRIVVG